MAPSGFPIPAIVRPAKLCRESQPKAKGQRPMASSFFPTMIQVRNATVEDIPRMMEIAAHAVTAAQWTKAQYRQMFSPGHLTLVVQEVGRVVGFISSRGAAGEWEIENFAVRGSARRRGLGSRLLNELLHNIRCNGGGEVFLEVRESNHPARALYKKWAFIEAGRRKGYYRNPQEDAIVLKFSFAGETRNFG